MSEALVSAASRALVDSSASSASRKVQERRARQAIERAGGDPSDPLLVALVLERAQDGARPIPAPEDGGSWLYRLKVVTGWPDRFVAELMGQSRATVQAYIGGRIPETVTRLQARALVAALGQQRDAIDGLMGELQAHL